MKGSEKLTFIFSGKAEGGFVMPDDYLMIVPSKEVFFFAFFACCSFLI